jgi:predicted TPR repeat methyltransferase
MDDARACLERARVCLQAADFAGAESLLRFAIGKDPELALAYELLGKLLYRDARSEEAAAVYRAWLRASPADPVAAHLVAATGGAPAPARASDGFLTCLFGRAAPEFDTALARLGYRAPQLIFERATRAVGPDAWPASTLDLGCGTGQCGEWFRPLARRLVGVDVSAGMLEEARKRRCYDELVCAEITAYVAQCAECFDLITAADVFCYFGALEDVFGTIAALLQPRGWFVFSVERADGGAAPILSEHGRYAHSLEYIERALQVAGLSSGDLRPDVLRFERGAPVEGLVVAATVSGCIPAPTPGGRHGGSGTRSAGSC